MMLLISAFSIICERAESSSLIPRCRSRAGSNAFPYLLVCCLSDVEDLPSEGENSVAISPDDSESRHSQRLGRVSLGEDEGALRGMFPTYRATGGTLLMSVVPL